jgi:RNA polymerase sigma-70 factor (ECF subfamily)
VERAGGDLDEATLVRDVADGSSDAFARLYDRHAALVFATARRLTGDRAIAEEVTQETFLALWNRAELYDPGSGSLRTWLVAIARNRSLDRIRAAGRRPRAVWLGQLGERGATGEELERAMATAPGAAQPPDPATLVVGEETRQAVLAAIATLDDQERRVILLAYRDGLSQSEIAERLGWPLGTVKTRTRRALRVLRGVLAPGSTADAGPAGEPGPVPEPAPGTDGI